VKDFEQDDLTKHVGPTNDFEMNIDVDLSNGNQINLLCSNGVDTGGGSSGRSMQWWGRLEVFFRRRFD
jgi:hypothetical protein